MCQLVKTIISVIADLCSLAARGCWRWSVRWEGGGGLGVGVVNAFFSLLNLKRIHETSAIFVLQRSIFLVEFSLVDCMLYIYNTYTKHYHDPRSVAFYIYIITYTKHYHDPRSVAF